MIGRRWLQGIAVVAVAAGIGLAGVSSEESAAPPLTAFGYTVLAGDFHVHSFPDGIPAWDVVREARRRRLDVIALTSHNSLRGWQMWINAPWTPPEAGAVLVLPGQELTSIGYHVAAVGVTEPVPWRQPLVQSAPAVRAQGGVAILAHPAGPRFRRYLTNEGLLSVDGVEIAHPQGERSNTDRREFADVYQRASALNPRVAAIGSSDFHYFAPLGLCRTYVFVRERTQAGVLEAIRAGRTAACDGRGRAWGPTELSGAIADRCRGDATAPPVGDTRASRAGTVLAWVGLMALVLLGPGGANERRN